MLFRSPRAFGEAVLGLLADSGRRGALGRVAKVFARRFSWDDLARQYAAFFEEMLSDKAYECRAADRNGHRD